MTKIFEAACKERDFLVFENRELKELVEDLEIGEEHRMGADLRLTLNLQNIKFLDSIIEAQLMKMPVANVLEDNGIEIKKWNSDQ